ncbi:MAG: FTR1 family protein [Rhodospirillales bacterium]|nr:FTR1 family protein [Rhodospirillales bacterium]
MLGAAVIVFRETLEAALIVSIVMAATVGIPGRNRWVGAGVLAGIGGAVLVAAFAATIAAAAAGMGQELFNAAVLLAAVVMLGWHTVWMAGHGRTLASEVNAVGRAVAEGTRPLWALAVVAGVAVLREGSETVLFLYGIAAGGQDGAAALFAGGLVGIVAGALLGAALYLGLLRIPMRHLFAVTNWMVMLLAAGMAAQAANFLVQADLLPTLGEPLWDTSFLVSDDSLAGRLLHTLVGYVSEPSGIQLLFWAATLAVIGLAAQAVGRATPVRSAS